MPSPSLIWVAALLVSGLHQHVAGLAVDPTTKADRLSTQGNFTRVISKNDSSASKELYTNLIGILGKLDILSRSSSSSCHSLEKIVRQVGSVDDSKGVRDIQIVLFISENSQVAASGRRSEKGVNTDTVLECQDSSALISDAHPLLQDKESSNNSSMNGTTVASGVQSDQKEHYPAFLGLSRTQVVVISTCSAIIGTFFLVAAIMRIRNYVKRIQAEQQLQRRQTFRSCSFTLANNNSPSRDSSHSKTSPKGSYTVRMPKVNSSGKINSNGSRTLPDTKPLLTINPTTQPTISPSKLSNISLQYIDEDAKNTDVDTTNKKNDSLESETPTTEQQPLIREDSCTEKNNPINNGVKLETTRGWTFDQEITAAGKQGLLHENSSFDHNDKLVGLGRAESSARQPCKSLERASSAIEKYDGDCDTLLPLKRSGERTLSHDKNALSLGGISPITEEISSPEAIEYSNFGLTQSDESLSGNASSPYSYGNQTEYTSNNYPFVYFGSEATDMESLHNPSTFQENANVQTKDTVVSNQNFLKEQDSINSASVNIEKHSNEKADDSQIPLRDSQSNSGEPKDSLSEKLLPGADTTNTTSNSPQVCQNMATSENNPPPVSGEQSPQTAKQKHTLQRVLSVDDDRATYL